MSRRKSKRQSSTGVGRLFFWTAALGIVFSIGLIIGQRILLEESLPPIVSVGQGTPSLSMRTAHASEEAHEETPVFSFYDVLTRPEIQDLTQRVQPAIAPRPAPTPEAKPEPVEEPPAPQEADPSPQEADPSPQEMEDAPQEMEDAQESEESPAVEVSSVDHDAPARYTLQVASHPTMERARVEMDRLRSLDLDPHIVSANVPGQGEFYRVRIGKFHTMDEARSAQRAVQIDDSVQTFVTPL